MSRNVVYHMSEAYNIGYDDGWKDAVDMVCEWIMTTPMYAKQPSQLVQEFRKAMEDKE